MLLATVSSMRNTFISNNMVCYMRAHTQAHGEIENTPY